LTVEPRPNGEDQKANGAGDAVRVYADIDPQARYVVFSDENKLVFKPLEIKPKLLPYTKVCNLSRNTKNPAVVFRNVSGNLQLIKDKFEELARSTISIVDRINCSKVILEMFHEIQTNRSLCCMNSVLYLYRELLAISTEVYLQNALRSIYLVRRIPNDEFEDDKRENRHPVLKLISSEFAPISFVVAVYKHKVTIYDRYQFRPMLSIKMSGVQEAELFNQDTQILLVSENNLMMYDLNLQAGTYRHSETIDLEESIDFLMTGKSLRAKDLFLYSGTQSVSIFRQTIRLWQIRFSETQSGEGGDTAEVTAITLSKDGCRVAIGNDKGNIYVHQTEDQSLVNEKPINIKPEALHKITFYNNGKNLIVAFDDDTLFKYDIESEEAVELKRKGDVTERCTQLTVNVQNTFLVASFATSTVVWNLRQEIALQEFAIGELVSHINASATVMFNSSIDHISMWVLNWNIEPRVLKSLAQSPDSGQPGDILVARPKSTCCSVF